jgi:hypothetical protein
VNSVDIVVSNVQNLLKAFYKITKSSEIKSDRFYVQRMHYQDTWTQDFKDGIVTLSTLTSAYI